jgi:energy-coupling factor transport system ATP-binding protein
MKAALEGVEVVRGTWSLACTAVFSEGRHLVAGRVGSGKTTLAEALAGVLRPKAGRLVHEGIASMQLSFQFPEYHVTEPTVGAEACSCGCDPDAILAEANLADRKDENPLRLSRGELKRLHLACILANDADMLLLDEPFSSLDCREKARAARAIEARSRGITVVFTHEQWHLPRIDELWELDSAGLHHRGRVPAAIRAWQQPPPAIAAALAKGCMPENISARDVEAACRTRD